jgi:hypothetical protein
MWDNRCTVHRVSSDFVGERIIHRATVAGDVPARYMSADFRLDGQVALVTGASRNIGAAIATAFRRGRVGSRVGCTRSRQARCDIRSDIEGTRNGGCSRWPPMSRYRRTSSASPHGRSMSSASSTPS